MCICFVHAALFGWAALEPCHHGPLEVGVVPKGHHRGQTCIDAYCFGCYKEYIYIYIFIAIPTIALTKKILSSSDPHQLTFYLTYITSDIRGLHFFQKKLQDVLNDYVLGKLASLRKMKPHELTFFDKPDTGPASMEMVPGNCTEWYS